MLSQLLIGLRKSVWMDRGKRFVPHLLRRAAWQLAHRQEVFEVMGSRMCLPLNSRNRDSMLDRYEPEVSRAIQEYLKPGMTFVDVGANIGVFTLLAGRLTGPKGRVLAFEPVPANFEVLAKNVALNRLENVVCVAKAVSSAPGQARLFLSTFAGSHSLTENPAGFTGDVLEVEVVRLDSVSEVNRIDLLKIDVEGGELEVIEGLGMLPVGKILLEYNGERLLKRSLNGQEFIRRLHALGCEEIQNIDAPEAGLEAILQNSETTVNLAMRRRPTVSR